LLLELINVAKNKNLILGSFFILITSVAVKSVFADDVTRLGGDLTSDLPGRAAIQVNAPNVTNEPRRLRQLEGFSRFHNIFTKTLGLGPHFNQSSCGGCHIDNGRGPLKFSKTNRGGSTMVVKISLRGLNSDGSPKNVPGIGEQLQDQSVQGARKTRIELLWTLVNGEYADGTKYRLRRPRLNYTIDGMSRRKLITSLRMTPPVIGPGLLEAVSDETILEYSDPDDLNGDGISGHPNYVPDLKNGGLKIGRFGFRASHIDVEQQSAAALINDIGITNPILFTEGKTPEFTLEDLDLMVIYQKLAGVPPARDQENAQVINGKALFQSIGCDSCHRMTLTTGTYIDPELSNQTFHPFTDLLLHDMGTGLADKRAEFSATGREWKTAPLWGLGFTAQIAKGKAFYLHDGRARTIEEAILWHGGEALSSQERFKALSKSERDDLLLFLKSL
jgi:CxxC motif-containing protein (DUF1111 family)